MKKFSIILPVRNGGDYVKECVNSILSQTLKDFNLIVLDNCSTDGTREWISSLNDERIIIHTSSKSLSIEENWSRVVSTSKNEYVTLIGHDDILLPNYLQVMNELITKYPEASIYQSHFSFIDAKGNSIRKCRPMETYQNVYDFLRDILLNKIDITGTGFLMRSNDYDALGGIPACYPNLLFADFELWLKLTQIQYKATSGEEAFYFRLHNSTTSVSSHDKYQQAFEKFLIYLEGMSRVDTKYKEVIENNANKFILHYCQSFTHRILRTPGKRQEFTVKNVIRKSKKYIDLLSPGKKIQPLFSLPIFAAFIIDSNNITRNLFLQFKRFFPGPVLK
jgi:glycosyltransferase involved in cell wall biosynthesis